jgi:tripartite-type tricarboxylate transporter receptor subunit TctC
MARHYGKYIPGHPTIIVRNMPGAGSLNAVLYTAEIAPADGLTITAFNSGLVNETINEGSKAKISFDQFAWIGSLARDLRVCFAMKDSGIAAIEDLKKRKHVFGGSGVGSSATNNVAMMRNLFGLDLQIISAYRGNSEMYLAAERGEISGSCVSWSSLPDHWIKQNKINLLARLSRGTAEDLPADVKFLGDLTQSTQAREVIDYLMASGEVGRPLIVSRKVPAERIKILQEAFDATLRDPDFLADAARQISPSLRLMVPRRNGSSAKCSAPRLISSTKRALPRRNDYDRSALSRKPWARSQYTRAQLGTAQRRVRHTCPCLRPAGSLPLCGQAPLYAARCAD